MDAPDAKRCPHYQMRSEPLETDGPASYLAVRRCLLTERMIILLSQFPDGKRLADKLVVTALNNRSFAFVGPDLEAVTQQSCTVTRCENSCTPAYLQHLDLFDVTDPNESEVTCDDEDASETKSEAMARLNSSRPEAAVNYSACS